MAETKFALGKGTCMFNYQKCMKRRNFNLKDRISGLPDELVISILSFLTIKEAARTSILSSRWIDLWKYMTGSLNFDAPPKEVFMQAESPELVERRTKYVNWINQVLCLHKGTCISEFRVWFDMDLSFKSQIDNWINFAIQKKVRRLELHLRRMNYYDPKKGRFPFPSLSLVSSRPTTLIELRLICVEVTGEVLECFLSNCPNLEEICVEDSPALVTLKISGPSLKLNNLEIVNCHYMKLLEISAVNLVSFKYHGPELSHLFMSVPRLTEGSFAGEICECHQLLSFVSQLEKLVLVLRSSYYPVFFRFPNFPTLRNLKQLELEVFVSDDVSALRYIPLIKASPSLYSFSLQFSWEFPSMQRLFLAKIKKHALKSLRLIRLAGFAGRTTDVEFAQYMLENVVSLEKITIDTRRRDYEEVSDEMIEAAKKCAEELRTKLPPGGAEMLII